MGGSLLETYVHWNWSWTIDGALRYAPVVRAISATQCTDALICDVGAGSRGGITSYAKMPAVGVDLSYAQEEIRRLARRYPRLRPICASATSLPLKSGAFDFVICIDTLEHLPKEERTLILDELFRIVRDDGWVIIGAPCGSDARYCDEVMNHRFRERSGIDHPCLKEHLLYEPILPGWFDKQVTLRAKDRFDDYYIWNLGNVSVKLRYILGDLLWSPLHLNQFQRLLFRPFLPILTRQNREPCYRRIYFTRGERR